MFFSNFVKMNLLFGSEGYSDHMMAYFLVVQVDTLF